MLATVLGEAGIGKTRLVHELAAQVAAEATVLTGRCLPYGDGITFWPLRELVAQAGAPEGTRQELEALLDGEADAARVAEWLAGALGPGTRRPGTLAAPEIFWATRRLLETLARRRPLVVVLEDLHWAEPTFLDLAEAVATQARQGLLLVCLARPELLERRPAWAAGAAGAIRVELGPLAEGDAGALLGALAGAPPEASRRLLEVAAGNPLFLEQLAASLGEQHWGEDEPQLPATIQALLAARLELLGPGERAVLWRAAVIGRDFTREAVAELLPAEGRGPLGRHLRALAAKGLVEAPPPGPGTPGRFHFHHLLVQQAAYRAIPKSHRAELHQRFAGWSDGQAGRGRDRRLPPGAGGPLPARAGAGRRRGPGPGPAGRRPPGGGRDQGPCPRRRPGRGAPAPAGGLAAPGRRPGPGPGSDRPGRGPDGGGPARPGRPGPGRGRGDRRGRRRPAAGRPGPGPAAAAGPAGRHGRRRRRGRPGPARVCWRRSSGPATRSAAARPGGCGRPCTGCRPTRPPPRTPGARRPSTPAGPPTSGSSPRCSAGWPRPPCGARPRRPRASAAASAYLEEVGSHQTGEAVILNHLAGLYAMQDRVAEARELLARGMAAFEELGVTMTSSVTHPASFVAMLAGDAATAEAHLRRDYEGLEAMGEKGYLATTAAFLAQAIAAQGRLEEAERFIEVSREAAGEDDLSAQMVWQGLQARILAARGRSGEAEELARSAVALAARTDFLNQHGDALLELALVLEGAGRTAEARAAIEQALDRYRRKGNLVAAAAPAGAWSGSAPAERGQRLAGAGSLRQRCQRAAYGPSAATSSSWVPSSVTRPSSTTATRSASWAVWRRWAMATTVRPARTADSDRSRWRAARGSSSEVASSRTRVWGSARTRRARATCWAWADVRLWAPAPTVVSRPSGRASAQPRASTASRAERRAASLASGRARARLSRRRAGEDVLLLGDQDDVAAELVEGQLDQADPADGDRPGPGRVDPGQQAAKGRLAGAAAGRPWPAAPLPGGRDRPRGGRPGPGVGEADVAGGQPLRGRPAAGGLAVGRDVGDPEQTGEGGRAHLELVQPGQQDVDRLDQLAHVEGDGGDLAHSGQPAGVEQAAGQDGGRHRDQVGALDHREPDRPQEQGVALGQVRPADVVVGAPDPALRRAAAPPRCGRPRPSRRHRRSAATRRPSRAGSRRGRGAGTSGSRATAAAPRPGPTAG